MIHGTAYSFFANKFAVSCEKIYLLTVNAENIKMGTVNVLTRALLLVLTVTAFKVTDALFDYASRNWFLQNASPDSMSEQCLPNGSPCRRITDCCSNWCHSYAHGYFCEPSTCGCPQPPWTPEPIVEWCFPFGAPCNGTHHTCCTGYCMPIDPYAYCWRAPCTECE